METLCCCRAKYCPGYLRMLNKLLKPSGLIFLKKIFDIVTIVAITSVCCPVQSWLRIIMLEDPGYPIWQLVLTVCWHLSWSAS